MGVFLYGETTQSADAGFVDAPGMITGRAGIDLFFGL